MVKYYILIKRKSAKKWSGAIPAKKGVSLAKLRNTIRKQIKAGYTYRITNKTGIRKYINNILKKKNKR